MHKHMGKILGAFLILTLAGCKKDEQKARRPSINKMLETKVVHDDVRELYRALYSNDLDAALTKTHPAIIKDLGGMSKARETLAKALASSQSKGMQVKELSLSLPPSFIVGRNHEFAVVPTIVTVMANGLLVESHNFQFGVRLVGGTQWKYFEGSRITPESVRKLFPDFPDGITFPECTRRKL